MNRSVQKNFIGLTGGIGAGKSTVSARFAALGAAVLDADAISRQALETDGCCYSDVVSLFGDGVLQLDGSINRRRVAAIVFSDAGKRRQLNDIVHPAVQCELLRRASAVEPQRLVVFDVPLLFESGWHLMMHKTIVVAAEERVRIARICARDGCTVSEAMARIRAQMPQEQKCRMADFVLTNDGSVAALHLRVDALYAKLCAALAPDGPTEVCT